MTRGEQGSGEALQPSDTLWRGLYVENHGDIAVLAAEGMRGRLVNLVGPV